MSNLGSRDEINQKKIQLELTVQELKMMLVAIGSFSDDSLKAEVSECDFLFNPKRVYKEDMGSPCNLFSKLNHLVKQHTEPKTKTVWISVLMNKFDELFTTSTETEDELDRCLKDCFSECRELKRFSQEVEV